MPSSLSKNTELSIHILGTRFSGKSSLIFELTGSVPLGSFRDAYSKGSKYKVHHTFNGKKCKLREIRLGGDSVTDVSEARGWSSSAVSHSSGGVRNALTSMRCAANFSAGVEVPAESLSNEPLLKRRGSLSYHKPADLSLFLLDLSKRDLLSVVDDVKMVRQYFETHNVPQKDAVLLLSKTDMDRASHEICVDLLIQRDLGHLVSEIIPISTLTGENLHRVEERIVSQRSQAPESASKSSRAFWKRAALPRSMKRIISTVTSTHSALLCA